MFGLIRLILGILLIMTVWLAPTGIALLRNHPRIVSIILWNTLGLLLLGIGWLVALVISLSGSDAIAGATPAIVVHNVINSSGVRMSDAQMRSSSLETLAQLGPFLKDGVITQAEFDAKKAELLKQL
jgi:hypothetical protein